MNETINAPEVYLFGYPVQVSVKISDTEIVDVTHAVQFDGKSFILAPATVLDAIDAAVMRGFGLRSAGHPGKDDPASSQLE